MIAGSVVVAFGCLSLSLPEMIGGVTVIVASLVCILLLISMIYLIKCLPSKVQQTITLVNNKTSSLSSFQLLQNAYAKLIYSIIDKEQRIERLKQEEYRLLLRLQKWQEIAHATPGMPSSPSNNHNFIS
ncbi:putative inner membrane protein [Chlamydia abortus]|nr:putative inner membrane protein [Chlamydia abortus]